MHNSYTIKGQPSAFKLPLWAETEKGSGLLYRVLYYIYARFFFHNNYTPTCKYHINEISSVSSSTERGGGPNPPLPPLPPYRAETLAE